MTGRAVPEWIGSSPDAKIPVRVKLRIWTREKGRCYLSGRKIEPGDSYEFEHIKALCNGGEHRESNIALALSDKHKVKTAADVAEKAKVDRIRKKHAGIPKRSSFQTNRAGPFKAKIGGGVQRRSP